MRETPTASSYHVTGAEVPTSRAGMLDPAWLAGALPDVGEGRRIISVEVVGGSKTLAEKVLFTVAVDGCGTTERRAFCAKAHLDGSPGADIVPEALFYRDLAPRLDVRMPRIHYVAVDEEAEQAIIIMDDVSARGGVFLSARTPYEVATARATLTQLARLHAVTWGDRLTSDLDWLSPRLEGLAATAPLDVLQALLNDGRAEGLAPELRDARRVLGAMRRTAEHELTCVIHGDPHSGNSYLDAQGRTCWLDWQVVQPGNWATDISYHLATVLDVDSRRRYEVELLRHYLAELESFGAPAPAWDDAWDLYTRSFAYGYFLWVITTVSSREIVLLHMPRLGTAMTDHDTFGRLGV